MALDQEVIDARLAMFDNEDLETALASLAAIVGGSGEIEIFVKRGKDQMDFTRLKAVLDSSAQAKTDMITNVETHILTAIGATEVQLLSIRKELRDLVDANDVAIAAI